MKAFFAIPAAGAAFFFSAWLTMMFWGILAPDLGVPKISYTKAMVVTIALWLVLAPLAGAVARRKMW
ncbi:MAG: hypothetical protein HY330_06005 [Chloroflexi bacterium]|nr:hypothetical protein [Chloroflexota bacterium]